MRCFDIVIGRAGSLWRIHIPEIDACTHVARCEDAEMVAREHIAAIIDFPIAEVAVRVVKDS